MSIEEAEPFLILQVRGLRLHVPWK